MKQNNIFQEIKDWEVDPPQDIWDGIEKELDQKKKRRRIIFFLFSIAFISTAVLTYFAISPNPKSQDINPSSISERNKKQSSDNKNIKLIDNEKNDVINKIEQTKLYESNVHTSTSLEKPVILQKNKTNSKNEVITFKPLEPENETDFRKPLVQKSDETNNKLEHAKPMENITQKENKLNEDAKIKDEPTLTKSIIKRDSVDNEPFLKKIKIEAFYSPVLIDLSLSDNKQWLSDLNGYNTTNQSWQAGFHFILPIKEKWQVSTGLTYTQLKFKTENVNIQQVNIVSDDVFYFNNYSISSPNEDGIKSTVYQDIRYNGIDLIGYYRWHQSKNEKLKLYALVGANGQVLDSHQLWVENDQFSMPLGEVKNLKSFLFTMKTGVQLKYEFGNHFGLTLTPEFNYLFNPIENKNFKPLMFSTRFGLIISL